MMFLWWRQRQRSFMSADQLLTHLFNAGVAVSIISTRPGAWNVLQRRRAALTAVVAVPLGVIIIGTQLNGSPDYLGPAIVFSLVDLIAVLFLSVEIGRR